MELSDIQTTRACTPDYHPNLNSNNTKTSLKKNLSTIFKNILSKFAESLITQLLQVIKKKKEKKRKIYQLE